MKKPKRKNKRNGTNAVKRAAPAQASAASSAASKRKFVVAGLAAAAVLAVAGAFAYDALPSYLAPPSGKQVATAAGGPQYSEQARVEILEENRDLGTIRVSDERTAEFLLRNVGGKPLHISQVQTSCMCTFAQVVIDDKKSPLFNMEMHNSSAVQSWKGSVDPGLSATIRVIYRPSLMPV